jgi:ketosteroid isomerase-like protein
MAQPHARDLDLALAGIDALNRRDADALAALSHPRMEIRLSGALGEPVGYDGRDAIAAYLRDQDEHWTSVRIDIDRIHALGSRVLVTGVQSARGRASGIPVRTHLALLMTVARGRITAVHGFRGSAEAVGPQRLAA